MRDYSTEDRESRLAGDQLQRNSEIAQGIEGRVLTFQKIFCNLNVAQDANNALKISVPFRSLFVRNASDSTAVVYFSPNENSIGNIQEAMPIYKNDSFNFGRFTAGGYLWWPAQPGKTMDIFLATSGEMKPGSQVSQIAGGLSVSDGSALSSAKLAGNVASISVGTSATKILDADTDRKLATLYIPSAVWIGDASVAVGTRGIYFPGGILEVRNTAAVYGIVGAGTVTVTGNDER